MKNPISQSFEYLFGNKALLLLKKKNKRNVFLDTTSPHFSKLMKNA